MNTLALVPLDELEALIRNILREELARLQTHDDDRLLTAQQAADFIGTSENAIRIATSRGKIRSRKNGTRVRYLVSDLLEDWS